MTVNRHKPPITNIVRCAADFFTPFALVYGFAVILHGHLSPGGGFQGGCVVAGAAVLLWAGYGYEVVGKLLKPDTLKAHEAAAAICYVLLALLGVVAGAMFCSNVLFQIGDIGDFISAGTIAFMNYAVGYKVLTGVACLLLLLCSLLSQDQEEEEGGEQE